MAPLIEHLGLNTLIITDLDAVKNAPNRPKARPERGVGLLTGNNVLKKWHPQKELLDEFLDLKEQDKEKTYDESFSVRVAYQMPIQVALNEEGPASEGIPRTFEDALAFENINLFRNGEGTGLLKKFKDAIMAKTDISELGQALFDALASGTKAEFALDLLYSEDPESIKVPEYIHNGLAWMENKLLQRLEEVLVTKSEYVEAPEKDAK